MRVCELDTRTAGDDVSLCLELKFLEMRGRMCAYICVDCSVLREYTATLDEWLFEDAAIYIYIYRLMNSGRRGGFTTRVCCLCCIYRGCTEEIDVLLICEDVFEERLCAGLSSVIQRARIFIDFPLRVYISILRYILPRRKKSFD